MASNDQITLVLALNEIKDKVWLATNRSEIASLIQTAIKISTPVEPRMISLPDGDRPYNDGKELVLTMLAREAGRLGFWTDIEDIQLQISCSITMLMTKFVDGLHGINAVLKSE